MAKRLAHAFPWCPSASVHLALCLRRRSGSAARTTAAVRPSDQKVAGHGDRDRETGPPPPTTTTTNLNVLETKQMAMIQHLPAGARRRRLIKVCVCMAGGGVVDDNQVAVQEGGINVAFVRQVSIPFFIL